MMAARLSPTLAAIMPFVADAANDLVVEADREIVDQMAEVMAHRIQKTGCCSTGALIAKGFAERDVYRLWLPVCSLADEKLLFSRKP